MISFFLRLIIDAFLDNLANESTFFKLAEDEFFFESEVEEDNFVNPFCHWFKSDNDKDETLCFLTRGVNSSIPSLFKYD